MSATATHVTYGKGKGGKGYHIMARKQPQAITRKGGFSYAAYSGGAAKKMPSRFGASKKAISRAISEKDIRNVPQQKKPHRYRPGTVALREISARCRPFPLSRPLRQAVSRAPLFPCARREVSEVNRAPHSQGSLQALCERDC